MMFMMKKITTVTTKIRMINKICNIKDIGNNKDDHNIFKIYNNCSINSNKNGSSNNNNNNVTTTSTTTTTNDDNNNDKHLTENHNK